MCEHNLVIGKEYTLKGGRYNCYACHESTPMDFCGRYIGEYLPEVHQFVPAGKYHCKCGIEIVSVVVDCRGDVLIDVTQEFLSLPVRSRG